LPSASGARSFIGGGIWLYGLNGVARREMNLKSGGEWDRDQRLENENLEIRNF